MKCQISNIKCQINANSLHLGKRVFVSQEKLEIENCDPSKKVVPLWWKLKIPRKCEAGFTLIELLVVIGIIGILLSIATFNLVRSQHTASISATVDELVGDLRAQQTKAMVGTIDTSGKANSYGISFASDRYNLFQGTSDPNDSTDFSVTPVGITFSTTLPGSMINFTQLSGEICATSCGSYTITVKNASGTEQRVLTINKYGVITDNQLQ